MCRSIDSWLEVECVWHQRRDLVTDAAAVLAAMSTQARSLPYRIPGPAGNACERETAVAREVRPASRERIFQCVAWQSMLQALRIQPYGQKRLECSIALLRSAALQRSFDRASVIPVRIETLTYVGKDASVKLIDPTASIGGTIHAEVFTVWKNVVDIGAVLLLRGVNALAYPERRPTGFHEDVASSLHVSIQTSNIERVFSNSDDITNMARDVSTVVKAYTPNALEPPRIVPVSTPRRLRPTTPQKSAQQRAQQRAPDAASAQRSQGQSYRRYPPPGKPPMHRQGPSVSSGVRGQATIKVSRLSVDI